MILVAPFTSIPDVGARIFPFLPAQVLARDRFDSAAKAPEIEMRVLILHGEEDDLVPAEMGRRLAGLFPDATLLLLPGAGHDDVLDGPQALAALAAFIRAE